MIQANILLSLGGKAPDSFAVMDLDEIAARDFDGRRLPRRRGYFEERRLDYRRDDRGDAVDRNRDRSLFRRRPARARRNCGQDSGILTLWAMEWIDLRIPREHRRGCRDDGARDADARSRRPARPTGISRPLPFSRTDRSIARGTLNQAVTVNAFAMRDSISVRGGTRKYWAPAPSPINRLPPTTCPGAASRDVALSGERGLATH